MAQDGKGRHCLGQLQPEFHLGCPGLLQRRTVQILHHRHGDELELVGPDTRPFAFAAGEMWDAEGVALDEPKKPEMKFTIQLPKPVPAKSVIRRAVDLSAK